LRAAITDNTDYMFETTLGGQTVTGLLLAAAAAGYELVIWYCGLDSPERHLARVAARVAGGGPETKVRAVRDQSRQPGPTDAPRDHTARLRQQRRD